MRAWAFLFSLLFAASAAGQVRVSVPGDRQIALAGRPAGTSVDRGFYGKDVAPANSPILAGITLQSGQGLQFAATGTVGLPTWGTVGPNGKSDLRQESGGLAEVAFIRGPAGALVAVFLPDRIAPYSTPPDTEFVGGAQEMEVLRPMLQQPFFIGDGKTPAGRSRIIVTPPGATRLFLAVCSPISSANTGSFDVDIAAAAVPDLPGNPLRVHANTQIGLAGREPGYIYYRGFEGEDAAPLNAPAEVRMIVTPGQRLRFAAAGSVRVRGTGAPVTPDGDPRIIQVTGGGLGISQLRGPEGALVGIFLWDQLIDYEDWRDADFTSAASRDAPILRPALQQPFFIGTGLTSNGDRRIVIVPEGARRLFLGVSSIITAANSGSFIVAVSPGDPGTPEIAPSGVRNAAGFGPPPLAPQSLASIFGKNLNDKFVWFDLTPARVLYAAAGQVNVLVPSDVAGSSVAVVLSDAYGASLPSRVAVEPNHPGIFILDDASPVTGTAGRGDVLTIYCTGLGPAPATVAVLLGGAEITPLATAEVESLPGVQTVRFLVPAAAASGDIPLQIRAGANLSNRVTVRIRD